MLDIRSEASRTQATELPRPAETEPRTEEGAEPVGTDTTGRRVYGKACGRAAARLAAERAAARHAERAAALQTEAVAQQVAMAAAGIAAEIAAEWPAILRATERAAERLDGPGAPGPPAEPLGSAHDDSLGPLQPRQVCSHLLPRHVGLEPGAARILCTRTLGTRETHACGVPRAGGRAAAAAAAGVRDHRDGAGW